MEVANGVRYVHESRTTN